MNSIRDFPILREELNGKKTPEAITSPCTLGKAQTRQIENIGIKQDGKQVRYTAKISKCPFEQQPKSRTQQVNGNQLDA